MSKQPEKMLELYQFESCPYCQRVRSYMSDKEMSYVIHSVPRDKSKRTALKEITGGEVGVPSMVDPNTGTVIVDDDDKIIEYLEKHYL